MPSFLLNAKFLYKIKIVLALNLSEVLYLVTMSDALIPFNTQLGGNACRVGPGGVIG